MGSEGAEVGGGESMITVCATGAGACAAGTGAGGRGRLAIDGAGDGDGAGEAIVTTALGFDAAIAAIARGFVNGMTLGATAAGFTTDGIAPPRRGSGAPLEKLGLRASIIVISMSSKLVDVGRARRAREESRRLGEVMNDETLAARGPPSHFA
jgi:hypothetical protein